MASNAKPAQGELGATSATPGAVVAGAAKGGQQSGVDVEDAAVEGAHQLHRDQLHHWGDHELVINRRCQSWISQAAAIGAPTSFNKTLRYADTSWDSEPVLSKFSIADVHWLRQWSAEPQRLLTLVRRDFAHT